MSDKFIPTKTVVIKRMDREKKSVPLICSWCNRIYKIDDWLVEEGKTFGVSHGICRDCFDKKQGEFKMKLKDPTEKYACNGCGYVYNPEDGEPDQGIKGGSKFEQLPDEWICPDCGAEKKEFTKL